MKIKHRALALILSAIMVFTFMPALAFADEEDMFTGEMISGGMIEVGTAKEVKIEKSYDYYSFVFTPSESNWYTFSSSGDVDTYARVVEAEDIIGKDDESGGNGNFAVRFFGVAGAPYYLEATGFNDKTGTFEVAVNETEEGWWVSSTDVDVTFYEDDTTIRLDAEQYLAWKGEKPEDITYTWYKNTADPESDRYTWEEMEEETNSTQITVPARFGDYRCTLTDSEDVTEDIYFYVRGYDYDDEGEDDSPNEEYFGRVVATGTIKAGEVKNATVSNPHDYVSYTFTPTVSGKYCFRSTGGNDGYGRVLDENGDLVDWDDDANDEDLNFCISFNAVAGKTYYLQGCLFGSHTGALTVELLEGSYGKDGDWWCSYDFGEYDFTSGGVLLEAELSGDIPESGLKYEWYREVYRAPNYVYQKISGATGPSYNATTAGVYKCEVTEYSASGSRIHGDGITFSITVPPVIMNGMRFVVIDDMNAYVATTWSEKPTLDGFAPDAKGNISIPASVKFVDNITRKVTVIDSFEDCKELTGVTIPSTVVVIEDDAFEDTGLKSITIPATVTKIGEHAVGYTYTYNSATDTGSHNIVPGFVIFGKTGSAAHNYAKANGITFRDLAAEQAAAAAAAKAKEAARQGTPDKKIAKVKISKPSVGKKSVTVKWKKLSSKQIKKGKVKKYEIWVCPNKAFGPSDTIMKEVSKSKSSGKVKVPKKGKYYVKVRAIRKVGNVKYVGKWSSPKKVKVKK